MVDKKTEQDKQTDGLGARRAALEILMAILARNRPLDESLHKSEALRALPTNDRAFARLLIHTVLRRLPEIDAIFEAFLARPLPNNPSELKHLLRIGTAQLIHLKTPPHAAVDTCVSLAERLKNRKFKGLVNAVLRKVAASKKSSGTDSDIEKMAHLNTPDWLWQCWVDQYGEANASAIGHQHLKDPPLDISVKCEPEKWAELLDAELLPTGSLRRTGGGDPSQLPGFEDGHWWVQDAAATLPVKLLGDLNGKVVIDLCAAPGGKTAQLITAGAAVTAVDISKNRMARLSENLERLNLTCDTIVADMRQWRPEKAADIVLLDAPCTSTGTCRRHPDILRLRAPADVEKLAEVQKSLLSAAADMVLGNGLLVYVTCSLQPEEGPDQITAYLADHPNFRREPFDATSLDSVDHAITEDGALRTLPNYWADKGGMDGFFAVALRRIS